MVGRPWWDVMASSKVRRNDPCPCGSGRKYKHCCARKQDAMSRVTQVAIVGVVVAMAAVLVYTFTTERTSSGGRQVWDPAHGHYHTVP